MSAGGRCHTLEASGIFLVHMAVCDWATRLCVQSSVWLYGVYTGQKDKQEAVSNNVKM